MVQQLSTFQEAKAQGRVQQLRPLMHRLRWVKSPAELALMRASAGLAVAAMEDCLRQSHPGVGEHRLAALFEFRCKEGGAARMAYPPVVAGGADACTIHYSRNDKVGRWMSEQLGGWSGWALGCGGSGLSGMVRILAVFWEEGISRAERRCMVRAGPPPAPGTTPPHALTGCPRRQAAAAGWWVRAPRLLLRRHAHIPSGRALLRPPARGV